MTHALAKNSNRGTKETVHAVTVVKPNPALWAAALKQAAGDAKRIEILSPTNLVVHPARR